MKTVVILLSLFSIAVGSNLQHVREFHHANLLGVYANVEGQEMLRSEFYQQPPAKKGWAVQYSHAESSQGPCKGSVESVFAVPTGVCLIGLTSVQSSFEYICNTTTVIRNTYYGLGCDQNQLANSAILNNNEEACIEAKNNHFAGTKYLSFLCTDNTQLPLPVGEAYVVQTSFNKVLCTGDVTGIVGIKNDYCFALNGNANTDDDYGIVYDDDNYNSDSSQRLKYPHLHIYNSSSTCQGPVSIEPIPVGCNPVPDPDTQGLSYEFTLETGGQDHHHPLRHHPLKRLLSTTIKDEMVDNVAGFLILVSVVIGIAMCAALMTSSESQPFVQSVQAVVMDKDPTETL